MGPTSKGREGEEGGKRKGRGGKGRWVAPPPLPLLGSLDPPVRASRCKNSHSLLHAPLRLAGVTSDLQADRRLIAFFLHWQPSFSGRPRWTLTLSSRTVAIGGLNGQCSAGVYLSLFITHLPRDRYCYSKSSVRPSVRDVDVPMSYRLG